MPSEAAIAEIASHKYYESRRTVNKLESQLICQWGILIGPNNFLILNNGKQLKKKVLS